MKCRILFSGKNKKNIINLSSAELAQRGMKVKIRISKACFLLSVFWMKISLECVKVL